MAAVWRFKWWILAVTVLGTLGGVGGAHLLPPKYQAQATIWIQSSEPRNGGNGGSRGPIGSNQLFDSYAWVNLLRSYVVLDEVARDLRFYLRPAPGTGAVFLVVHGRRSLPSWRVSAGGGAGGRHLLAAEPGRCGAAARQRWRLDRPGARLSMGPGSGRPQTGQRADLHGSAVARCGKGVGGGSHRHDGSGRRPSCDCPSRVRIRPRSRRPSMRSRIATSRSRRT